MKRLVEKEISGCRECPILEIIDGREDYSFRCVYKGQTKSVPNWGNDISVSENLIRWFSSCPKCKKVEI
jgi:hypothetical protein